jgi:hypothetical protein
MPRRAQVTAEALQLFKNGSWSPRARALVRLCVRSGTAREAVGVLMNAVCKASGTPIPRKCMCRRTVSRALIEGGMSVKIQLGKEMSSIKSMTTIVLILLGH